MIDVHVLCPAHKPSPYFRIIRKQMEQEKNVNFFIVGNDENIGLGRVTGFSTGTSPFVSFVDDDDMIEPGIFSEIESAFERGFDWVYTDEIVFDDAGNIKFGWASNPELWVKQILDLHRISKNEYCHHILAFRRELFTKEMSYIMRQLPELSEVYLKDMLVKQSSKYFHLKKVGYFWRIHPENSVKNFYATKEITKTLEEEE